MRSAVTSDDIRSIAVTKIACAVSSISRLIASCSLFTKATKSPRTSCSVIIISLSFASALVSPAIFSNFSCCFVRISRISVFRSSISFSCRTNRSDFFSSWSNLPSSKVSRSDNLFSVLRHSRRRSSSSFFDFSATSAASFRAFDTISDASFLALRTKSSALFLPPFSFFLLYTKTAPAPPAIPTAAAIIDPIISISLFLFPFACRYFPYTNGFSEISKF